MMETFRRTIGNIRGTTKIAIPYQYVIFYIPWVRPRSFGVFSKATWNSELKKVVFAVPSEIVTMTAEKTIHKKGHHHHQAMDITFKIFDSCSRTMDSLKKSLDTINDNYTEQDKAVNFGVGYVEDKKLTHGMSLGAINHGVKVYGGTDLLYNPSVQEYIHVTKYYEVHRYTWSGTKLASVTTPKRFTKLIYMQQTAVKEKPSEGKGESVPEKEAPALGKLKTGYYIGYNPGKSIFYIFREDFSFLMDSVSVVPISKIIYGEQKPKDEVQFDFFIISSHTLYKYTFHPVNNVVSLQETLKASDIEAEKAFIEQTCFDNPPEYSTTRKQWMYLTYKQHCTVVDTSGRFHGSKKFLHDHKITAISASGPSDYVVTGDETGLLKMWGQRWTFMTQIQPHSARVSHIIEHPNGQAALSFSRDLTMFAWSFSTRSKLESMKATEIVEHVAINKARKGFMVNGPRKLCLWKMDVVHYHHTQLSAPISNMLVTINPSYPLRAIVSSVDNTVRLVNPLSGNTITTALVLPKQPPLASFAYIPQNELLYSVVQTDDMGTLEMQVYDTSQNPAKAKYIWKDSMWDSAITAIALYDYIPSILCVEIGMKFTTKKVNEFSEKVTFIIAGRSDGGIARLNMNTGETEFYTQCHSTHVHQIVTNPEVNQFATCGVDPSVRLWKVAVNQDDIFIPLFEISWDHLINHVFLIREQIAFTLSKADITAHKVVIYNTLLLQRFDHKPGYCHEKEIISLSGSNTLNIFCSASKDETIRIWSHTNELVRLICLNWVPSFAGFATRQGDLFVGIENAIHLVPADKFLSVIYRNRVMMSGLSAGRKENGITLNMARAGQDQRMYFIFEEMEKKDAEKLKGSEEESEEEKGEKKVKMLIPAVEPFQEAQDSQRAKDLEKLRFMQEDLMLIVEGNHPLDKTVPDPRTMTKKQWDDYGKYVFKDDGEDRKYFVSESRLACMQNMKDMDKELSSYDAVQ